MKGGSKLGVVHIVHFFIHFGLVPMKPKEGVRKDEPAKVK